MAHHNSTPESVLKAPVLTPVVVYESTGLNRRDRRWRTVLPTGRRVFIPKRFQRPATNTPYRKPVEL
jgi:hypothetical protein